MSAFSLMLQVETAQLTNICNFRLVAGSDPQTQSLPLTLLILAAVAIKYFGVMTGYFILLGDIMNEANLNLGLHEISSPASDRRLWILTLFIGICSWNVVHAKLEKSTKTSAVSLCLP